MNRVTSVRRCGPARTNPRGRGFGQMYDLAGTGDTRSDGWRAGAVADAPISGSWFTAQFQQFLTNAYPHCELTLL